MKKVLACAVALALVLCMVPMAFAANPALRVEAVVDGSTVTATVYCPIQENLVGFSFFLRFDPTVLTLAGSKMADRDVEGEMLKYFDGECGLAIGTTDTCTCAWTTTSTKNVSRETPIAVFTFKVINADAETTNLTLEVNEYKIDGEVIIGSNTPYAATPVTLKAPAGTTDGPTDGTTEAPGKTDLDKLKDAITEAGLTMPSEEELKAILNKIDNGTLDDIKEALQSVFAGSNIDELYNKILNLFGKGTTTTTGAPGANTTTKTGSTTTKTGTTTAKANSKLDKTGDVGIALAATVCLAAAAAFVLTKKKED